MDSTPKYYSIARPRIGDRPGRVLREVEQRLGIARRLATCIRDPRAPERVVHGLKPLI